MSAAPSRAAGCMPAPRMPAPVAPTASRRPRSARAASPAEPQTPVISSTWQACSSRSTVPSTSPRRSSTAREASICEPVAGSTRNSSSSTPREKGAAPAPNRWSEGSMSSPTYPQTAMDHHADAQDRPVSADAVLAANATNNARSDRARRRRWRPARAAAWALLDPEIAPGARVAVVGAGNGDDLPLGRLARRAGQLDLVDLDRRALAGARRRARLRGVRAVVEGLPGGAGDAVLARGGAGAVPDAPIGAGGYDVVVCDLVLTQLLYPALKASGTLSGTEVDGVLLRDGQRITDGVVARLHAAAPGGTVVILHDLLGWWDGHDQPFTLEELLARGARGAEAALKLARRGSLPYGCDPWLATRRAGAHVMRTAVWQWPFGPGADYAVFGLVTR